MELKGNVLMKKYELGRLLGQGTFAKVYHAKCIKTGESVAIKAMDKEKILQTGMIEQIKREISVMRLVRHPNIVQLYEVMASKTKIYFVMEYVNGGELFDKVAQEGKLKEDQARKYFQQLISAVDFCHSRGVFHRDLKPENLLLDEAGNLKISDFGLSALPEQLRKDGLLHTTCGTPAYAAPEVILNKGYDGARADIWSCGVVLFVLLAGFMPFHDANILVMYKKICKAEFRCPRWLSSEARKLILRLMDPNPNTRITVSQLMEFPWFRKGFRCPSVQHLADLSVPELEDVFQEENKEDGVAKEKDEKPLCLNAFDIISLSPALDLSGLFESSGVKRQSRFISNQTAASIVCRLEDLGRKLKFKVRRSKDCNCRVKLQGQDHGRKGQLAVDAELFELAPHMLMMELSMASGDTLEYNKFCTQQLRPGLKDIVWAWQGAPSEVN